MPTDKRASHSQTERVSHAFSKFFATSPALVIGIIIMGLWLLSLVGEKKWHESLVESVGMLSFLTIFAFQRSQNKEMKAIQIKLDELIASSENASNRLIKAEEAPEHVLDQVHEIYKDVAKAAMEDDSRKRLDNIEHAEKLMETFHQEAAEDAAEELTDEQVEALAKAEAAKETGIPRTMTS